MPAVLCGLTCFDVPTASTASAVAREFSASLNPALNGAGCPVEVYRLEKVAPDVQLLADDVVVCSIPGWQFDFASLEDLHCQFEELQSEHDNVMVQYSRTKEVLISLNASIEATEGLEAAAAGQRRAGGAASGGGGGDVSSRGGNRREVEQLKTQLIQSEKKQQETKATVVSLRHEFMQLVDMMSGAGGAKCQANFELPSVMKELDANVNLPLQSQQYNPYEADRPNSAVVAAERVAADAAKPRHVSQPPTAAHGARRPVGSPRVLRAQGAHTTPRPGARPRGLHQRSGHSAGATIR